MPKVPVYQQNQVQESQVPERSAIAKPSAETFGGGDAGFNKVVDAAAPIYEKVFKEQREKADKVVLYEADARLSKLETSILHDPKTGALNKQGRDAFDVGTVAMSEYEKSAMEIEDSLPTEDQKIAFSRLRLERGSNIDRALNKHISTETVRYESEVATNFVKNEQDAAIKNYQDPERVRMSLEKQETALKDFGAANGMSEDKVKQMVLASKSKTHSEIINRLLNDDQDQTAQAYFDMNKDTISGDDLATVEAKLETGSTRGKSQRFVDAALKSKLTETEAINKARDIKDPKERDAAYDRTKMEYSIRDAARKKGLEDYHVGALNLIDKGGGRDLTKVSGWNEMDVSQRNSLTAYAKLKSEGKEPKTNWTTYYDLQTKASADGTKDAFISENLLDYRMDLDNTKFTELVKLQASMRKGERDPDGSLKNFTNMDTTLKGIMREAGLNPDNKDDVIKFKTRLSDQQDIIQSTTGKKMSPIEYKEAARDLVKKRVIENNTLWFDKEVNALDGDVEDLNKAIKFEDVPKTKVTALQDLLRKNKMSVSNENVRLVYIKSLMRGRK